MNSEIALSRLLARLRSEFYKRRGQIGQIETELERGEGYFRRQWNGSSTITLKGLLETLEYLKVDIGDFFGSALDIASKPEHFLRELEDERVDPLLAKIERASLQLEAGELLHPTWEMKRQWKASVAELVQCKVRDQYRRLQTGLRYRSAEFTREYLEHLDALRYDRPRDAMTLSATVAQHLVPLLHESFEEKLALQCRAIGIFGSANRMLGEFGTAARAIRFALELSRRHPLSLVSAELLQRGAYVLRDHGEFDHALELVHDACISYLSHGRQSEVGRTLVDRGIILSNAGRFTEACSTLRNALSYLQESLPRDRHNLYAVFFELSRIYCLQSDYDAADSAFQDALRYCEDRRADHAKLLWQWGKLRKTQGDLLAVESLLHEASELLEGSDNVDSLIVALDLVEIYMEQGKREKAWKAAQHTITRKAHLLKKNRVVEAAFLNLAIAAFEGNLSSKRLENVRQMIVRESSKTGPDLPFA